MKKQLRFLQSGMGCTERIQATYSALSGASKKIADFVIDHPDQAVHMTVVQLAESCEVSEASVVRFCQCLQYAGFYEFKLSLAAEIVPASQMIQEDITGIDSRIGIDDYDCLIHASMLRTGDVAIGISHSGSTKNTIKMLEEAKKNGATTICITGMEKAPITRVSDICMVSHSKETMFRSMAMASRIAQMAIIDALVVAVSFKRFERSKQYLTLTDKILVEDKM